jgi:hypothetical protein
MMKHGLVTLGCMGMIAIAGCASQGTSEDGAQGQVGALVSGPTFVGTGAPKAMKVKDYAAKEVVASDEMAALLAEMTKIGADQNASYTAATYTLAQASDIKNWDDKFNCNWYRNSMAYDLMWRSDGSDPGASSGFGYAAKWEPDFEQISCQVVKSRAKALSRFQSFQGYTVTANDKGLTAAQRTQLQQDAARAVDSLLKDAGSAALYACHWDNADDTNLDALVTVDEKAGQLRVLAALAGP